MLAIVEIENMVTQILKEHGELKNKIELTTKQIDEEKLEVVQQIVSVNYAKIS